jgi:hypothetical protein
MKMSISVIIFFFRFKILVMHQLVYIPREMMPDNEKINSIPLTIDHSSPANCSNNNKPEIERRK